MRALRSAARRAGNGRILRTLPANGMRIRVTRVVLATAYLDHDPTNNGPRNLAALCQRCHMLHDQDEHQRRRHLTYRVRRALGDLCHGPYRAR